MRKKPNIIQLAYGQTAPYAFKSLIKRFNIACIITPGPKISLYRDKKTLEVEKLAQKHKVKIIKNNSFAKLEAAVKKYQPKAVIISSYNKVIPPKILSQSTFINAHHGDLPRWRGRANVNWAIILGKKFIGLTIHQAAPDLDAGPIYAQYKISINQKDTVKTVYDKMNKRVEKSLAQVIARVIKGFKGRPQKGKSTYCITRLPQDGLIDWSKSTIEIDRLVRALTKPYPGAFTYFNNQKMIVWQTQIPKKPRKYAASIPGRVSLIHKKGVEVLTGDGSIILTQVTLGKKSGNAAEFIKSVKTSLGIDWVSLYESTLR